MTIGMSERSCFFSLLYQVKLLAFGKIMMFVNAASIFHVSCSNKCVLMGAEVAGLEE